MATDHKKNDYTMICSLCCTVCVGRWAYEWAEGAEEAEAEKVAIFRGDMASIFHVMPPERADKQQTFTLVKPSYLASLDWTMLCSGNSETYPTLCLSHTHTHRRLMGNVYSVCLKESDSYRPCKEKAERGSSAIKRHTQ